MTMELIDSKFQWNDMQLNIYGTIKKPWFKTKEVGKLLNLKNIYDNTKKLPKKYKLSILGKAENGLPPTKTSYINESGLYRLAFKSHKKEAEEFADWVCETVLPEIRLKGSYSIIPNRYIDRNKVFYITNETQLHHKVTSFIHTLSKEMNIDLDMSVACGETQDTDEKRLDCWKKGYQSGTCDIIINHLSKHFNGLVLELKTPTGQGVLSEKQKTFIEKKRRNKFDILVSNDYDEIIKHIMRYFGNLRIECPYCIKRFISEQSRKSHVEKFHKKIY